jgi:hypothetical protein
MYFIASTWAASKAADSPVFSWKVAYFLMKRFVHLLTFLLISSYALGQCTVYDGLGFGYSYDLSISKLITNSGGAHEISIIYEIASERKKRKRRRSKFIIPCAKF